MWVRSNHGFLNSRAWCAFRPLCLQGMHGIGPHQQPLGSGDNFALGVSALALASGHMSQPSERFEIATSKCTKPLDSRNDQVPRHRWQCGPCSRFSFRTAGWHSRTAESESVEAWPCWPVQRPAPAVASGPQWPQAIGPKMGTQTLS